MKSIVLKTAVIKLGKSSQQLANLEDKYDNFLIRKVISIVHYILCILLAKTCEEFLKNNYAININN